MPPSPRTILTIFNPESIRCTPEANLLNFLNEDERRKYQKLDNVFKKDFIAGRIALVESLIKFYNSENMVFTASNTRITYHKSGKPFLEGNHNLEISISHSSEWGAALVSDLRGVAVDIEKIKSRNISTIEYVLSKEEQNLIKTKITDEILTIFWTMKESIMKALGIGLMSPHSIVLESFLLYDNVYIASFMYQSNQTTEIRLWSTKTILVDKYAISVAYPHKLHESIIFDWNIKIGLQPTEQMFIS